MTLELLVILVLVLANGLLSLSEMAIVSVRRARLRELAEMGSRGARVALALSEDPNRFLAAIQIGITLIGIVSGAYAGVTVGEALGEVLAVSPLLAPHSKGLGVGIVVVCITFLSLVLGELVPKRLAMAHAERLSVVLAPALVVLSRLATPLTWVLTLTTSALTRPLASAPFTAHP